VRAVVVGAPGGPETLRLVEIPPPEPGPDEVVVEVEAVGVNPVDLGIRSDPTWAGIRPPYVVGYELAGRVVDTGEPVWALLPVQGTTHGGLAEQGRGAAWLPRSAPSRAGPHRGRRATAGRLYGAPGAAADAVGRRVVGARARRDRRGRPSAGADGPRARSPRRRGLPAERPVAARGARRGPLGRTAPRRRPPPLRPKASAASWTPSSTWSAVSSSRRCRTCGSAAMPRRSSTWPATSSSPSTATSTCTAYSCDRAATGSTRSAPRWPRESARR